MSSDMVFFYVFLLCTTTSPIAFTYILPIISLIVIFKDEKFMIYCAVANMLSLIASIAFHIFVLGQNTAIDHKTSASDSMSFALLHRLYHVGAPPD